MRFLKIKYSNNKVELKFEKENKAGDMDEYAMKCAEKPLPEFDDALQALAPFAVGICELSDDPAKYRVSSVSLSWTDDVMGATITAAKVLVNSNSPLVINTPHKPAKPYGGGDPSNCLDPEAVMALNALQAAARRYVDGQRSQLNMFAADQPEPQEAAA